LGIGIGEAVDHERRKAGGTRALRERPCRLGQQDQRWRRIPDGSGQNGEAIIDARP
jgi:hypothetical protein